MNKYLPEYQIAVRVLSPMGIGASLAAFGDWFGGMYMRRLLMVSAAMLVAAPSFSTVIVTTYTGTVGDVHGDYGPSGLFGTVSVGTQYSLVYRTDDSVPGATILSDAHTSSISGAGTVTAALTINGITKTIAGSQNSNSTFDDLYDGFHLIDRNGTSTRDYAYIPGVSYHDYSADSYISSYLQDFLSSPDFRTPFSYTFGADGYYNYVYFNDYNYLTNTQVTNLYLNLAPATVTASVAPGVPEPASWAMMLGGFGLIGGTMRRRARIAFA